MSESTPRQLDAVVIGAGFGGLYALHLLRQLGLRVRVFDDASSVGGTWAWNRYPGARVDFPGGPYYCYTFSQELVDEWDWPETQPDQPAVLAYLNHVADRFDLRRDISLSTRVTGARYDEAAQCWEIELAGGERVSAQFLVCATGALSAANRPNIPGLDRFGGECYHTGLWPQQPVSFAGKRVGVIGTGSSGIQAIPVIAREAAHLNVFQRTPQYAIPARNRPLDAAFKRQTREQWPQLRATMLETLAGTPFPSPTRSALDDTPEQRTAAYEQHWQRGGLGIAFGTYGDLLSNAAANETLCEFVRGKIRQTVRDPALARRLLPSYPIGTKRLILDEGYYETFNRANVALVDLREDPIVEITPHGVRTERGEHPLDMLVLATGFDAITGALLRLNPRGRGGRPLSDAWAGRFSTYLGLAMRGFPNLFMIHGPESPSVLYNMPLGAERQAQWIRDCIADLRRDRLGAIEAAPGVEADWGRTVAEIANQTLFPRTDSWYTGANIPGKHRQFPVHLDAPQYFATLQQVAAAGYQGFMLEPSTDSPG
ncbi:MAG TPA: cyclohexanone monooxygenase [Gammaproteobacteria bacterium]|nr:cyclohexanone monooxygenase [Gammaproteobacteria bacterium]